MINDETLGRVIDSTREAAHFFENHLPRMVGKLLLKDYVSLNCRFDVSLADDGGSTYALAIGDGRLIASAGAPGVAQVVYTVDSETLIDIVTARVTPQDAFYDMRVDISGDMERGLELGAVFEDFFRFHPYALEANS